MKYVQDNYIRVTWEVKGYVARWLVLTFDIDINVELKSGINSFLRQKTYFTVDSIALSISDILSLMV